MLNRAMLGRQNPQRQSSEASKANPHVDLPNAKLTSLQEVDEDTFQTHVVEAASQEEASEDLAAASVPRNSEHLNVCLARTRSGTMQPNELHDELNQYACEYGLSDGSEMPCLGTEDFFFAEEPCLSTVRHDVERSELLQVVFCPIGDNFQQSNLFDVDVSERLARISQPLVDAAGVLPRADACVLSTSIADWVHIEGPVPESACSGSFDYMSDVVQSPRFFDNAPLDHTSTIARNFAAINVEQVAVDMAELQYIPVAGAFIICATIITLNLRTLAGLYMAARRAICQLAPGESSSRRSQSKPYQGSGTAPYNKRQRTSSGQTSGSSRASPIGTDGNGDEQQEDEDNPTRQAIPADAKDTVQTNNLFDCMVGHAYPVLHSKHCRVKGFETIGGLADHIKEIHVPTVVCPKCSSFRGRDNGRLRLHLVKKHSYTAVDIAAFHYLPVPKLPDLPKKFWQDWDLMWERFYNGVEKRDLEHVETSVATTLAHEAIFSNTGDAPQLPFGGNMDATNADMMSLDSPSPDVQGRRRGKAKAKRGPQRKRAKTVPSSKPSPHIIVSQTSNRITDRPIAQSMNNDLIHEINPVQGAQTKMYSKPIHSDYSTLRNEPSNDQDNVSVSTGRSQLNYQLYPENVGLSQVTETSTVADDPAFPKTMDINYDRNVDAPPPSGFVKQVDYELVMKAAVMRHLAAPLPYASTYSSPTPGTIDPSMINIPMLVATQAYPFEASASSSHTMNPSTMHSQENLNPNRPKIMIFVELHQEPMPGCGSWLFDWIDEPMETNIAGWSALYERLLTRINTEYNGLDGQYKLSLLRIFDKKETPFHIYDGHSFAAGRRYTKNGQDEDVQLDMHVRVQRRDQVGV